MKLRCRINFHRWKQWQAIPASRPWDRDAISGKPDTGVIAGQLRQCADCLMLESQTFHGAAFNLRPLRQAVRDHVEDLRRCVDVVRESEFKEELAETASEMATAANELSDALRQDEGQPLEMNQSSL